MSDQWIRASEIAEFVYCRRSWWLRHIEGRESEQGEAINAGIRYHRDHGRRYQISFFSRQLAYLLLALATLFFLVFVIRG